MSTGYHKASKKQKAYIESLADQTGADLPWGWSGWSMQQAAVLIRKLERKVKKQEVEHDKPEQTALL